APCHDAGEHGDAVAAQRQGDDRQPTAWCAWWSVLTDLICLLRLTGGHRQGSGHGGRSAICRTLSSKALTQLSTLRPAFELFMYSVKPAAVNRSRTCSVRSCFSSSASSRRPLSPMTVSRKVAPWKGSDFMLTRQVLG